MLLQALNNSCNNMYNLFISKVITLIIFLTHHCFVCHGLVLVFYFILCQVFSESIPVK